MNKRLLQALLVIPLSMFLFVPYTAHAFSGNTYTLTVECDSSSSQFAFADLTFLGHYVHVLCPVDHFSRVTFSFSSTASGIFVAKLLAGTNYQTDYGTFGRFDCFADNGIFGPGFGSYAVWEIDTSGCDT